MCLLSGVLSRCRHGDLVSQIADDQFRWLMRRGVATLPFMLSGPASASCACTCNVVLRFSGCMVFAAGCRRGPDHGPRHLLGESAAYSGSVDVLLNKSGLAQMMKVFSHRFVSTMTSKSVDSLAQNVREAVCSPMKHHTPTTLGI